MNSVYQEPLPTVAEAIREIQGRSSREMRDVKHQDLITERLKSTKCRQDSEKLRAKVATIASINEVLLDDNRYLQASRTPEK